MLLEEGRAGWERPENVCQNTGYLVTTHKDENQTHIRAMRSWRVYAGAVFIHALTRVCLPLGHTQTQSLHPDGTVVGLGPARDRHE